MPTILFPKNGWMILTVVMVLTVGCSNQKKQSTNQEANTVQKEQQQPKAPSSLPPNSAHVVGTIQKVRDAGKDMVTLQFKINQIMGYGSSTKPLSENRQLQLTTSSSFLKENGITLSKGDSLRIIISQTMTLGEKSDAAWRIVDFK